MRIAIIGLGCVGLTIGACFASQGHEILGIDCSQELISNLNKNLLFIFEPGLEELIRTNRKRIFFDTKLKDSLNKSDIVFLTMGKRHFRENRTEEEIILELAQSIGQEMNKSVFLVIKSTVPMGTADEVVKCILAEQKKRQVDIPFVVASNPEFLREGSAVNDFLNPERVIVGSDSSEMISILWTLYSPFLADKERFLVMDRISAEMTKYASNAMLATRISFMNEMANLCETVGGNVDMLRLGMGLDSRIGMQFLSPGCGYGGSCLGKDNRELIKMSRERNKELLVLEAVEKVNIRQKIILYKKLLNFFGSAELICGKTITIFGASFKPETNDLREAPSMVLLENLIENKCHVNVYDPVVKKEDILSYLSKSDYTFLTVTDDPYEAVINSEALVIVTEWSELKTLDWDLIWKKMKEGFILDGRNSCNATDLRKKGFKVNGIGY